MKDPVWWIIAFACIAAGGMCIAWGKIEAGGVAIAGGGLLALALEVVRLSTESEPNREKGG